MIARKVGVAAVLLLSAWSIRGQGPHVLMISIDGMKPEYVTQAREHHLKLPVLEEFLTGGTYADGVTGVIPTVTYPSHTTMATGVPPAEQGIYANTLFDPLGQHSGEWYWYFRELKAETIYQAADKAGLTTAAVGWPVTVGAPIDYLIAEFGRSEKTGATQGGVVEPANLKSTIGVTLPPRTSGDEKKTLWTIGIIDTHNPNLVLCHLTSLDHQEHEHAPFSPEADAAIETIDGQVGRLIDAELKKNPDAKIVIVSDHGFVRVDHKVALNVLFERAGLLRVRPDAADDGTLPVISWDAEAWESGGTAAVMIRDRNDPHVLEKVKRVLAEIASDPQLGVDRVVAGDEIARHGGNPETAFVIDFKPGWAASKSWRGPVVKSSPSTGAHGYLPDHPELRSALMMRGSGVAKGRDLGVVDMLQIAPTVAQMLAIPLPAAKLQPVSYAP